MGSLMLVAGCGWGLHPASALQGHPGGPFPPAPVCPHTGTEWENPRAVHLGQAQCTSVTFDLTIGVDGLGAAVTASFHGCPAFVVAKPGRYKKIQKLHHQAVNPQPIQWLRTDYDADCGGFFTPATCTATGSVETTNSSTTWEEEGCDFQQ